MTSGARPPEAHGSVAEEIAALAEALRSRGRGDPGAGPHPTGGDGRGSAHDADHGHGPAIDACEICPVCRAIAALHTISPAAVTSLADLAHQAELTLRALAVDLHTRGETGPTPSHREDIPVDDLGEDVCEDVSDE